MIDPQTPLPPLTAEDYKALTQLVMSQDAGERAQGASLAKTLTPQEQQAFFDYQKQAHGAGPADLHRNDNQVAGMPPEMVPLTALRLVPGAVRSVAGGVGLAGKAMAGAGVAGPIVAADLSRRGLQAVGVPSWAASGIGDGIGILLGGRAGAGRAAAEAPLSAEGQAIARAARGSTSGVPTAGQAAEMPTGGSVRLPESVAPPVPSTTGRPTGPVGSAPTGGSVRVTLRMMPQSASGSGLPAPGASLTDLRGAPIRPSGGFFSNPDEAITSSIPPNTGGPLTEAVRATPKRGVAGVGDRGFDARGTIPPEPGRLTPKDLTPDERAAFDGLVKEGYTGSNVLAKLLAARLSDKLGGS